MASVHQVSRRIEEAMKEKDAEAHATVGIDSILHVISAALDGTESGWLTKLTNQAGQLLFSPEEAEELEPKLEPLAVKLREMAFESEKQSQTGGDFGIDEMYEGFLKQLDFVNQKFQEFARSSGILHMELKSDFRPDLHPLTPLTTLLGALGGPVGAERGMEVGQHLPLPFRMIVFFAYLGLDLVRILMSIPGFDVPFLRQLLSVVASSVDILRGDWKKALLSFAGFFQASFVWMGFLGKAFLDMFYLIAPDLQEQIGWGTLSVGKSMIVGLLLKCFQIFAPYELRKPVYDVFGRILNKQVCTASVMKEFETKQDGGSSTGAAPTSTIKDATKVAVARRDLEKASLNSSAARKTETAAREQLKTAKADKDISPGTQSAADATSRAVESRLLTSPGALQSALTQPSMICSKEIQDIVAVASHSIFLRIALQLMRIPTTLEGIDMSCKRLYDYAGSNRTWLALLLAEGAADYLAPTRDKSNDDPDAAEKAKREQPHNQVKELKAQLDKYRQDLVKIEQEKKAAQTIVDQLNHDEIAKEKQSIDKDSKGTVAPLSIKFQLPPEIEKVAGSLDAIINDAFPKEDIEAMFPSLDYSTFLKIINYIVKVAYKNKEIEGTDGFKEFKNRPEFQVNGQPLTDDMIIEYIRPLYILFSNKMKQDDKYKILHTKLYEVDRLMNAIKLKEWSLIQPSLQTIEPLLQQAYRDSAKDRIKKENEKIVADSDTKRAATETAIEGVENQIIALIDKSVSTSEGKMVADATKAMADKSKAQFEQAEEVRKTEEAAKKRADENKKLAEAKLIQDKVQAELKAKGVSTAAIPTTVSPTVSPTATGSTIISDSPYGVAAAITKAVGDVLSRVETPQSSVSSTASTIKSLFSTPTISAPITPVTASTVNTTLLSSVPAKNILQSAINTSKIPIEFTKKTYKVVSGTLQAVGNVMYTIASGTIDQIKYKSIKGQITGTRFETGTQTTKTIIFTIVESKPATISDTKISGTVQYLTIDSQRDAEGKGIPYDGIIDLTVQPVQQGGTRKRKLVRRRLTKKVRFDLTRS